MNPSRFLTPHARGFAYVLTAVLLWSTAEVVVRSLGDRITPLQLAWLRFTLGALCLLAALPFYLRARGPRLSWKLVRLAAWMAVIGVSFASISFQMALKYAGAGVVAAVYGTSPLMVLLMSALFLGDPLTRPRLFGVVTGFAGIVVLAMSEPSPTFSLLGLGLAVSTVGAFAVFTILVKRLAGIYAGLPLISLCALFGSLYLVPLVWWEADLTTLAHVPEIWPRLFYLGVFTTGAPYLLYFTGVDKVDTTEASSMILLKPPVATLLAWIVLGEPITWNLAVAVVLVLSGLYLVIWAQRRRETERVGAAAAD